MPLADYEVTDPRMKRTRRLLQDGLRGLLRKKTLDEILVQEIADAATVNRATFYDHYGDKFDLFNALIAADFEQLLHQEHVCLGDCGETAVAAIVTTVADFLKQVHAEHAACTRQAASGPLMDAAVMIAVRRIVSDGLEKHALARRSRDSAEGIRVTASLVSGAIYSGVKECLLQTGFQGGDAALQRITRMVHPLLEPGTPEIGRESPPPARKRDGPGKTGPNDAR